MVNLTSLITYKKYCNPSVFNEVAKFHLAKYNIATHENHTRTWLTIMWNNFLVEANSNDIYDIIDNNMQSYFKWKKRISQLSILITIITGMFTIILNIYTYIKIYHFTSVTGDSIPCITRNTIGYLFISITICSLCNGRCSLGISKHGHTIFSFRYHVHMYFIQNFSHVM